MVCYAVCNHPSALDDKVSVMQLGPPLGGGVFPGKVTEPWATLTTTQAVNLGALFLSQNKTYSLEGVSVNGVTCSLFPKE